MRKLQVAVVDDDAKDREWLSNKLEGYFRARHTSHTLLTFGSGEEFISALQDSWFDIVFMDIYMSGVTGIEAAQALRMKDRDCKLVFLTSSPDHMRRGFSLNSAHYLIKPVEDEDFIQAMENCRIRRKCQVPFLEVPPGKRSIRLDTLDILYVEAAGRAAAIHTKNGTISAGQSFQATADRLLPDERFLLCNKGILINMDFASAMEEEHFLMVTGERLPIAPRRKKELEMLYQNYTFGSF